MNNINIYHPLVDYRREEFVTSEYGFRGNGFHNGHDIASPKGTDINAVCEGRIVKIENDSDGYGKYIVIEHDGFCTLYAHLSSVTVTKGAWVNSRDVIGKVGSTGSTSTGNHLHFEIRLGFYESSNFFDKDETGKFKNSVDPEMFFPPKWKEDVMIKAYDLNLIGTFNHKPTQKVDFGVFLAIIIRVIENLKINFER